MIRTKADLLRYIEADYKAYGQSMPSGALQRFKAWLFPDCNLQFVCNLRNLEYYWNAASAAHGFRRVWLKWHCYRYLRKHRQLRAVTGIEMWVNVAGPGLHISHGKCVVSGAARLGEGCKINSDVTIGGQGRYDREGAPSIGNRVYIGTGARVLGDIRIADDVIIGANVVVAKDITVAGIPVKKISNCGSYHYLNR